MYNKNFKISFVVFRNDEEDSSCDWVTEWKYLSPEEKNAVIYEGKFWKYGEEIVLTDDYTIATALCESVDSCASPAPCCELD